MKNREMEPVIEEPKFIQSNLGSSNISQNFIQNVSAKVRENIKKISDHLIKDEPFQNKYYNIENTYKNELNSPTLNRIGQISFQKNTQNILDDEKQSIITYTKYGDNIVNAFLRGTDSLTTYVNIKYSIRDVFNYILAKYSHLYNEIKRSCTIDTDCYKLNNTVKKRVSTKRKPNFEDTFVSETLDEEGVEELIQNRYYTFVYFQLLYNGIAKSPKMEAPFKVYRGVGSHYLGEDPTKIFYIQDFLSTTYDIEIAEGFSRKYNRKNLNLYIFYIHPQCNYTNIDDISQFGEKEILISPYCRCIFLQKATFLNPEGGVSFGKYNKYYYALLPTDLLIPDNFTEFLQWKNGLNSKPRNIFPEFQRSFEKINMESILNKSGAVKPTLKPISEPEPDTMHPPAPKVHVEAVGCKGASCLPWFRSPFRKGGTRMKKKKGIKKTRKLRNEKTHSRMNNPITISTGRIINPDERKMVKEIASHFNTKK
jgi:hypothetical protein